MTDTPNVSVGIAGSVGNTPLILLQRLSDALGRDILCKAEHLNPGGSVKDRAAKFMIEAAERHGVLKPGGTIVEGTAGNTGIGLAMLALAGGYRAIIVMPDNQSPEKYTALEALRAEVRTVKATKFADPNHFYHTAKRLAAELPNAVWTDQFENPANAQAHYETTGPEIWRQTNGQLDALVMSSGTGGTLGGTSKFIKEKKPQVKVVLADPPGSGLYSYVKHGEMKGEGSSITEGIGIMRLTSNFKQANVDDAVQVVDRSVVQMAHWLLRNEGLFVGSSSALNIWAAAQVARNMSPGARVVTLACDGGQRYQSRLFDDSWLAAKDLAPTVQSLDQILETEPQSA
jgi:cysteine synthase A